MRRAAAPRPAARPTNGAGDLLVVDCVGLIVVFPAGVSIGLTVGFTVGVGVAVGT